MKDLTNLRKIAENEPSHRWGQWTAEGDDWEGFVVFANDGLPGQSVVANGIRQGHDEGKATATFIATFNPEAVLALLSRLEQAEAAVARVREVLEHHTFVADDKYGDLAASQYYGDSELEAVAAKSITRALDGDGRG